MGFVRQKKSSAICSHMLFLMPVICTLSGGSDPKETAGFKSPKKGHARENQKGVFASAPSASSAFCGIRSGGISQLEHLP
jgi:hypothetical protein